MRRTRPALSCTGRATGSTGCCSPPPAPPPPPPPGGAPPRAPPTTSASRPTTRAVTPPPPTPPVPRRRQPDGCACGPQQPGRGPAFRQPDRVEDCEPGRLGKETRREGAEREVPAGCRSVGRAAGG